MPFQQKLVPLKDPRQKQIFSFKNIQNHNAYKLKPFVINNQKNNVHNVTHLSLAMQEEKQPSLPHTQNHNPILLGTI